MGVAYFDLEKYSVMGKRVIEGSNKKWKQMWNGNTAWKLLWNGNFIDRYGNGIL